MEELVVLTETVVGPSCDELVSQEVGRVVVFYASFSD